MRSYASGDLAVEIPLTMSSPYSLILDDIDDTIMHTRRRNPWVQKKGSYKVGCPDSYSIIPQLIVLQQKKKRYNRLNPKSKTAEPTYEQSYIKDDDEAEDFIVVDVGDRTYENKSPRTRSISNEATLQVDEEIGDRAFENNSPIIRSISNEATFKVEEEIGDREFENKGLEAREVSNEVSLQVDEEMGDRAFENKSPETRSVSNEVTLQVNEEILQNDGKALLTWAQDALLMLDSVPTIIEEEDGDGELSMVSSDNLGSADDPDANEVANSYFVDQNKANENTWIPVPQKIVHRDAAEFSRLAARPGVESPPFLRNDSETYQSPYSGEFRSTDQPLRTALNSSTLPGIRGIESIQNSALTRSGIVNSMGVVPVVERHQGQDFGLILRTFMSSTLSQLDQSSGPSDPRQRPPAPVLLEPSWTLASAVPSAFLTQSPFSPNKEYRPSSGYDNIETKVPRVNQTLPQKTPVPSIPTRSTSYVESIQTLSPTTHKTSKPKPHNAELPMVSRTASDKKKLRNRAEQLVFPFSLYISTLKLLLTYV
jgi:hypothetical protein